MPSIIEVISGNWTGKHTNSQNQTLNINIEFIIHSDPAGTPNQILAQVQFPSGYRRRIRGNIRHIDNIKIDYDWSSGPTRGTGFWQYDGSRKIFGSQYSLSGLLGSYEIDIVLPSIEEPLDPTSIHYAAGSTVEHNVQHNSFQYMDLSNPPQVIVQRLNIQGAHPRWEMHDTDVDIINVVVPPGNEQGIRVKMRFGRDSWKHEKKKFLITGPHKDGGPDLSFIGGDFSVVPLKTVIVAVDGLGYKSIMNIFDSDEDSTFKRVFKQSVHTGFPALAPMPTITFTAWPGIFMGRPPKDHGILGNSFFAREQSEAEPFGSSGRANVVTTVIESLDDFAVVGGELEDMVRIKGSIYDNIAVASRRTINVWSVHSFYAHSPAGRVNMNKIYYVEPLKNYINLLNLTDLRYSGHDPQTAKNLDVATGEIGEDVLRQNMKEIDILTLYFPGPDNIAHTIGQVDSDETNTSWGKFRAGPNIPDTDHPCYSIEDQIKFVTDNELRKIVQIIEEEGYLHATLFVLVGDHGLRAYRNTKSHNVFLPEQSQGTPLERAGLETFFTTMGLKVWKGFDIDDKTVVYSPNGGMAHIYIRDTSEENGKLINPWNKPAKLSDIEMVARQLYVEAIGGTGFPPCGDNPDVNMHDTACYAGLTKLNGALGDPPAIFVKVGDTNNVNHFTQEYRWLRRVRGAIPTKNEYADIDEFVRARKINDPDFNWPFFKARMEEMNDKNSRGSRSGDIVIIMDDKTGYLTVNMGGEYNGWHGGPSAAESDVPLMFNILTSNVVDKSFIKQALDDVIARPLRNWHMNDVLVNIYTILYSSN